MGLRPHGLREFIDSSWYPEMPIHATKQAEIALGNDTAYGDQNAYILLALKDSAHGSYGHSWPTHQLPPAIGYRPVQFALPILHARRRNSQAPAQRRFEL
jgi:hypothetical protein